MLEKNLFWDWHGTLTHPDSLWTVSVHKLLTTLRPEYDIKEIEIRNSLDIAPFPWHFPRREYTHLTDPKDWWEFLRQIFYNTYIDCGVKKDDAEYLSHKVRELIIDPNNYTLYDDTIDTLSALNNMGYNCYLLSNNFPELQQIMEAMGIHIYFKGFYVSALIGYEKPHEEIFKYTLNDLSLSPDQCCMIGDNIFADVQGGKTSGMNTILVNNGALRYLEGMYENVSYLPNITCLHLHDIIPLAE